MTAINRGFTLVELLVSLAIGALLLGILGNVLGGVSKVTRETLSGNDDLEERSVSARVLGQFLKSAVPPTPGDATTALVGSKNEIVFTATPPDSLLPFGVLRVRLYVDKDTIGQTSLFIDALPVKEWAAGRLELKRYRLFRNIASAGFEYLEMTETGIRSADSWSDASKLPASIGLTIDWQGAKPAVTIRATPRRTFASNCHFDGIGLGCRT